MILENLLQPDLFSDTSSDCSKFLQHSLLKCRSFCRGTSNLNCRWIELLVMSAKQCQNPCPGQPLFYQDMTRHYWAVKMLLLFCQSINQREILGNTLSPLGTQNKEYGHYFADVTNQGKILSTSGVSLGSCWLTQLARLCG